MEWLGGDVADRGGPKNQYLYVETFMKSTLHS